MTSIKRSDEILRDAAGRSLTKMERIELRESYNWEQQQAASVKHRVQEAQKSAKAEVNTNLPRHKMHDKCAWFVECPLDFKCRNYNPKYVQCQNCVLHETDEICHKTDLHNERNIAMMVSRPRIDLDRELNV